MAGPPQELSTRVRRSFIYPMARTWSRSASSPGSSTATSSSQSRRAARFKTHKLVRAILRDGDGSRGGAKTITEGGYHALPRASMRPASARGGSAGLVNVPMKGIHYAIGRDHGRRAASAAQRGGHRAGSERSTYDDELRAATAERPARGPEYAAGLRQGLLHAGGSRAMTITREAPARYGIEQNAERTLIRPTAQRAIRRPTAS